MKGSLNHAKKVRKNQLVSCFFIGIGFAKHLPHINITKARSRKQHDFQSLFKGGFSVEKTGKEVGPQATEHIARRPGQEEKGQCLQGANPVLPQGEGPPRGGTPADFCFF